MQTATGKLSYKVPDNSPVESERGKQVSDVPFEYEVCESESEAIDYITNKKWNIVDIVNDKIKGLARAAKYQNELAPHKPSEMDPEDRKNRMIRDFIMLGIPEETARTQVEALLKSQSNQ